MTQEIVIANARLILKNATMAGALRLRDGKIVDMDTGRAVPKGAQDAQGDYIAAGLVELHTDNLERHMTPRPNVAWPHQAALLAHDRELASAGITTVFDAMRVGSIVSSGKRYQIYAREMADVMQATRDAGALRISHHIHLRAEICSETLVQELAGFGPDDRVGIVSMMDHTPGQRQFRDLAKFEAYLRGKHNFGLAEFHAHVERLFALQAQFGALHEGAAVAAAKRYGAVLASHDDTTVDQVAASRAHGVTLAEFPTTVAAAQACHAGGIATMMGAPNLIRGGSHSGNVAAQELAALDRLDILSSDYVPAGLLMAALQLGDLWGDLSRGLATVTHVPAQAAGLEDRGVLDIGQRADIVRFSRLGGLPVIKETYCAGHRVF